MAKTQQSRVRFNRGGTADEALLARLVRAGAPTELERTARRVLAHSPRHPFALKALGVALMRQENYVQAVDLLRATIRVHSGDAELFNNLGIACSMLLRWDEALAAFEASLEIDRTNAETWKNLGSAYCTMHRYFDALAPLSKAIELASGQDETAVSMLAAALNESGSPDAARTCFEELVGHDRGNAAYLTQLILINLKLCDWSRFGEQFESWRELMKIAPQHLGAAPFGLFALPETTSAEYSEFASIHARFVVPHAMLSPTPLPACRETKSGARRLRIGYMSADYRNHPVGHVIPEVIERHDRAAFEIVAYSLRPDDGSDTRRRLRQAFDRFVDIDSSSVHPAANAIAEDGIDILIDLQGWTTFARPEVLALRPAPIIATWLGYAGTLGHGRLADYLIGDPVVTPIDDAPFYFERIAQLPGCYLPADTRRVVADAPSRSAIGLPEDAFVFCSFNNCYKFNPRVFDLWAGILAACPDAVLWLTEPNPTARNNLRSELMARRIASERLFFAPRIDAYPDHLARVSVADLALDPFPYNSHSTGIDTLWAGVPMVSLLGDTFPGRVGASLLMAAGLPELVARSVDEYRELATGLYADRANLQGLRSRLAAAHRSPRRLFDMDEFVRSLEALYRQMWSNYVAGVCEPILADRQSTTHTPVSPAVN